MILGKNFNFIHIMKTGGTWAQRACEQVPGRILAKETHRAYDSLCEETAQKPTYALVRNPWDWHVSLYHHMHTEAQHNPQMYAPLRQLYLKSFAEVLQAPNRVPYNTFSTNKYTLTTHIEDMTMREDGLESTIKWSRYEDGVLLAFLRMLEETGEPLTEEELRHINGVARVNVGHHKPYREYYTPALQKIVRETEAPIIEKWGYVF